MIKHHILANFRIFVNTVVFRYNKRERYRTIIEKHSFQNTNVQTKHNPKNTESKRLILLFML